MEAKCKTVFIATDGKAPITHNDIEEGLFHNPMSILAKHRAGKCTNMHLYVLDNSKVEIGDWVYDMVSKQICPIPDEETFYEVMTFLSPKKIIACTDKTLKLADISAPVIQLCIAEYNIGNKSVELEVEYEEGWLKDWEEENKKRQGSWYDERVVKLKLDPKDNTILISNFKAPKENFTAEEVKFIATRFAHACRLNQVVTNKETCELFDTWFKQIRKNL